CSYRRKVGLKSLDRDLDRWVGLLAPQFARGKHYRVEPLGVLASAARGGVGKDVAAANRLDRTELAASIARQTGMRHRVDIPGTHGVARLETRRTRRRPFEIRPVHLLGVVMGHLAVQPDPRPQSMAGGDLVFADEAMRHDAPLEP